MLKIVKHCQSALPSFVTGQLLGLDIGRTLDVTNCFPFPSKDDSEAARAEGEDDEDGAEYQMVCVGRGRVREGEGGRGWAMARARMTVRAMVRIISRARRARMGLKTK